MRYADHEIKTFADYKPGITGELARDIQELRTACRFVYPIIKALADQCPSGDRDANRAFLLVRDALQNTGYFCD